MSVHRLAGRGASIGVLTDERLRDVACRLVEVPGVAAVMLGGSRARSAELPDSDVDLGLYYRPPLNGAYGCGSSLELWLEPGPDRVWPLM